MNGQIQKCYGVLLMVLAVGCSVGGCAGATHTAATKGMPAKKLAVLSIPQLPDDAHVKIDAIQFDDENDKYEIGKGRDFYLRPGEHTASFNFVARVPKIEGAPKLAGWLIPSGKSIKIPGPKKIPLGVVEAGKFYELASPMPDSLDKLMENGQLSLVREKTK